MMSAIENRQLSFFKKNNLSGLMLQDDSLNLMNNSPHTKDPNP